jgi:hypothetical protein
MAVKLFLATLLALQLVPANATELCPDRDGDWSIHCFVGMEDKRKVKTAFLHKVHFNRHGLAVILIAEPRELVAINRRGRIVVPDIRATGDFDYPYAEAGLGRFYESRKDTTGKVVKLCGYFLAEHFRIVVPARFDQCQAFHDGEALACTNCTTVCTESECQDSVLVGGEGVVLGTDGKVKRPLNQP